MPKKVASPKQTGGGGFNFEDKAAAYFLACFLRDEPPLDSRLGTIQRIDFQTRAAGWYLDDLLLTLTIGGAERRCAFSIKSNKQFTSNGAPEEFVSNAWEQFLHEGTTQFKQDHDILGIITSPPARGVFKELSELLAWARDQDAAQLAHQITQPGVGTETKRNIFTSFSCPSELATKHGITHQKTGALLRCICVQPFDFQQESSQSEREAVQLCRSSLRNSSLEEGLRLWEKLQTFARTVRPNAGYIDRDELLALLRREFALKDLPCYEGDWNRLISDTKEVLEGIPDKIGNSVHLRREKERAGLETALQKNKFVVLLGPSGSGKSVIVKSWAEERLRSTKVIWVQASSLDIPETYSWESKLNLSHSFRELLSASPNEQSFCVIDGLDRVMTHFQNVKRLISAFNFNASDSPWSLVATCQPEEWGRVQTELNRANISVGAWEVVSVAEPDAKELQPVWTAFPSLRRLTIHPSLRALLLKPKILDLFASKVASGSLVDTEQWVGESDLVGWFWESEITRTPYGTMRGSFVKDLGAKLGDGMLSEVPIDSFTIASQAPVDSLIQDRICIRQAEYLSFQHDLYGDWARQRVLLGKTHDLKAYVEERLVSPLWCRAIRLYALHYLIEHNQDLAGWRAAIHALSTEGGEPTLGQDLLLEATIFGASPLSLLEKIWADLKANNGGFLKRLLKRFVHIATFPDPVFEAVARSVGALSEAESATFRRVPYWPYWPAMLRFLHAHIDDVVSLASGTVAEVADTWLRYGSPDEDLRMDAAQLALAVADYLKSDGQKHGWHMQLGQLGETICRAVLSSYNELPDRVKLLSLEACGRYLPPGSHPKKPHQEPWPDGPLADIDRQFQKTVLETDALHLLIHWDPPLAREVILALLIDGPQDPYEDDHWSRRNLSIEDRSEWFPPLYFRGPFLQFLRIEPREGLESILRLVKFATDRWEELNKGDDSTAPHVIINLPSGARLLTGDGRVYYWYRDNSFCPHPVAVALMALEKWLYEELDQKRSIESTIQIILEQSNSVAFAGVLIGVACRALSLFTGLLKPFLEVPEFLLWETQYNTLPHDEFLIGWTQQPLLKLAQEWHSLPHRKPGFHVWSQHLFLNEEMLRPVFEEGKARWRERLEGGDELKEFLEKLLAQYAIENYRLERTDDGREVWVFQPPEELQERSDVILRKNQDRLLILNFPFQCNQILKAKSPIPPEHLDTFWGSVQSIAGFPSSEDEESASGRANALCGGAAVLIVLHRDWLKQDPSKDAWCTDQLLRTIQNPPKTSDFDSEITHVDTQWDGFAAQAIPCVWSESPGSIPIRKCIALLSTSHHYGTVQSLFASASHFREVLGDDFSRLQHFLLRWASARLRHLRTRHSHRFMKKEPFDVDAWLKREIEDFINSSTPVQIPPWQDLEYKEETRETTAQQKQKHRDVHSRRSKKVPGFDLGLVKSAYEWVPPITAVNVGERQTWIGFWKNTLDYTIEQLGDGFSDNDEIEGTPTKWDRWVFGRVAALLLELQDNEEPRLFWQRIFELGGQGHYWVEDFLRDWFYIGLRLSPTPRGFLARWRQMIEYAFSSPQWDFKTGRWYRLEDLWCRLMGLVGVSDCWTGERKDIVAAMLKDFERWAVAHAARPRCAHALISFLTLPAAQPMLLKGLVWVDNARHQTGDLIWTEHGLQDSLSHLLSSVMQSYEAALLQDNIAFASFKRLLKELANRQDAVAMELYDHLLRKSK